jgi:hypothetical protein
MSAQALPAPRLCVNAIQAVGYVPSSEGDAFNVEKVVFTWTREVGV